MISLAVAMMTMRCRLYRNIATADAYGGDGVPESWDLVGFELPCYVFVSQKRLAEDGKKIATVEDIRGLFRFDLDIRRGDRIDRLVNRNGVDMLTGRLEVHVVTQKSIGPNRSHQEVSLRRIEG